jgi:hypothetical protein
MNEDPKKHLESVFTENYDEIVLLREFLLQYLRASLDALYWSDLRSISSERRSSREQAARIVDSFARRPGAGKTH